METLIELQRKVDGLLEKERTLIADLTERTAMRAALVGGLGLGAALARMLQGACRLVELKAKRDATRPAELPPEEAVELHNLNLTTPEQLLRVVRLDAAMPAKKQELADVTRALAEARAAIQRMESDRDRSIDARSKRPDLVAAGDRCRAAAAAVDEGAEQLATRLREFHAAEAELARLLNTPRAIRTLSFKIARDYRVHHALARTFELNPGAPGQYGVNVMLELPDREAGGVSRQSLAEQSDGLYRDLLAEAVR